jgi:hypothetical protein
MIKRSRHTNNYSAHDFFTHVTNQRLFSSISALNSKWNLHPALLLHTTCISKTYINPCLEVINGHHRTLTLCYSVSYRTYSLVYLALHQYAVLLFEYYSGQYINCCVTSGLGFQSSSVLTDPIKQTSAQSKLPYPTTIPWYTTGLLSNSYIMILSYDLMTRHEHILSFTFIYIYTNLQNIN